MHGQWSTNVRVGRYDGTAGKVDTFAHHVLAEQPLLLFQLLADALHDRAEQRLARDNLRIAYQAMVQQKTRNTPQLTSQIQLKPKMLERDWVTDGYDLPVHPYQQWCCQ